MFPIMATCPRKIIGYVKVDLIEKALATASAFFWEVRTKPMTFEFGVIGLPPKFLVLFCSNEQSDIFALQK